MRHFFRQFTKYDYLFFAICGIVYYLLVRQYIPCVEDLIYRFSKIPGHTPISTISDAIQSQVFDYMHTNGRFLVHTFVQLFCSIWVAVPFYIISALFFAVLVMGMTWWVRHRYGAFYADKYLLVAGLLFTIPIIGMTFLGHISFVVNYGWSAAIYVTFLCIYFYLRDEHPVLSAWQSVLLCLLAFVAGTWQESFSIGIAGALFFYHIVHLKETRGTLLYFLLCFALGVCVGIFAPGNFERLALVNEHSATTEAFSLATWLGNKLYNIKMLVKHCPAISVFCILLILIPVLQRKRTWQFVKDNYFLIVPNLIMFVFGCFVAFSGEHQFVIIGLFSTILFVNLLWATLGAKMQTLNKWIAVACTILILIVVVPSFYYRSLLCKSNIAFETSIQNPKDSICVSTEIEHIDREVIGNSFYRRYTNLWFVHFSYDSRVYCQYYSKYISTDNKIHTLVALPETKEEVMAHCSDANLLSDFVYDSPVLHYYIIRIPKEWDTTKVLCTEGTVSSSLVDKGKDLIMRRKGKEKNSTYAVGYPANSEDYSRWFIEGDYKYIIRTKPVNRAFSSASISYEN